MTKPTKLVIDCSTGVQQEIELTDDEIAQLEIERAKFDADKAEQEAAAAEKAAQRQSAIEKLAALGLSVDEVSALLN